MASLSLKNVCKVYPNGFVAVKDFNLEIADQEFIIFVGPSGCGKSTTLRMIAGLEEISSGELWIGDKMVNDVEPKDRDIAMVFQNYALYPHMSVYDNMAFGLKLRKVPKAEIDKAVHEAAKILDIEHLLDRKPKALSGGQRQRVAMGRAIVRNPKVFLMDEPLSNLDAKLRVQMRVEIAKIHKNMVVKLPMTVEGLKACKQLTSEGIKTNVTLVFTANQALLAARAGATYVSPFLGRLDDISVRGVDLVAEIAEIFAVAGIETEIIAASVRNPIHITDCALAGADIATVPYKVIEQMTHHPLTDAGIKKFQEDYIAVFGE